jgi:hypothetical protein
MKSRKLSATLIGLLIATCANGEIYQWKDKNGVTHFSETAPTGIENPKTLDIQTEYAPVVTPVRPLQSAKETITASPSNYTHNIQNPSTDAPWNQCAQTKRQAVIAEKNRARTAEQLNEWLWQNCRGYSNELRTIEQQMM